jgi:hypothetical protein
LGSNLLPVRVLFARDPRDTEESRKRREGCKSTHIQLSEPKSLTLAVRPGTVVSLLDFPNTHSGGDHA